MAEPFPVVVNGEPRMVNAESATALLDVLRGQLGLVGTRFGCGHGPCGACTVLLDGRAVQSCQLGIASVGDSEVTTVESLADSDLGRRLQREFEDHQAGQCGYCLSGILMTAYALLTQVANPTEKEVRTALDRHLCRCGAHNRIVRAILATAKSS